MTVLSFFASGSWPNPARRAIIAAMNARRTTIGYTLLLLLLLIPAWAPLTRPGLPAWRPGALPALGVSAGAGDWALLPARILHAAGLGNVAALKASIALGLILVGLLIFFGLRNLWGNKASLLSAVLALYAPIFLSAIYIEGAVASVWLAAGIAALLWQIEKTSWPRWLVGSAGILVAIFSIFHSNPQPPFSLHLLFESPWHWSANAIDLHAAFAWTPGLILLALVIIALWRLAGHRPENAQAVWGVLFTVLLLVGASYFVGDLRMAFLLTSVLPLAAAAGYALRLFPALETPAIWAVLLIMPILAAGPALSPNFVDVPIPEHPAAIFGDHQILLIDVRLEGDLSPGHSVSVAAAWQALQPIDFDYNIFIHVVDDAGQTVAQFDGQPRGGDRPMTTWTPGEIITDAYTVAIPADAPTTLRVQMGLYNWQSGQRLLLSDGSDSLTMGH